MRAAMFKTRDVQPGSWKYPTSARTLGSYLDTSWMLAERSPGALLQP